jgi:hypothetical protein
MREPTGERRDLTVRCFRYGIASSPGACDDGYRYLCEAGDDQLTKSIWRFQ